MPFAAGIILSLSTALFARRVGLDRDRAFYPTVLIVVASYYVLFAAMSGSMHALVVESILMAGFLTAAVMGFRWSPWIVVAALAGHGVLDSLHGQVVENTGVPIWWPSFCLAFDVGAATCLAWLSTFQGLTVIERGDLAQLSSRLQ